MIICTAKWNGSEAKITFTKEFKECDWITKADALVDIRWEIEKLYEKTLKAERKAKLNDTSKDI